MIVAFALVAMLSGYGTATLLWWAQAPLWAVVAAALLAGPLGALVLAGVAAARLPSRRDRLAVTRAHSGA